MGEWRKEKFNDDTMILWHGSPLRFMGSILENGILPRCVLPVTDQQLDDTAKSLAKEIDKVYGVKPTPHMIERAKYWARVRLQQTHGCVYTSGDKGYAERNCLAGDEWHHGIAEHLLGELRDHGKLPRTLNTYTASLRFYPDTKCALFELEVPVEDVRSIPENHHDFEVYEGKYDDPQIREYWNGTDDWYRHVFGQVSLSRVDPAFIRTVEEYQKPDLVV